MTTSFNFLTAATVLSSYSWDKGNPSLSGGTLVPLQTSVGSQGIKVTGYAPYVYVQFSNTTDVSSVSSVGDSFSFGWNFGDYYNQSTNTVTSVTAVPQSHVYLMPGTYTVSVNGVKKTTSVYEVDATPTAPCTGRHSIDWAWNSLMSTGDYPITLDDTKTTGAYTKTWDNELVCAGKYCILWSWRYTKQTPVSYDTDINSAVTWKQTKSGNTYDKTWKYEAAEEPCFTTLVTQTSSIQSTASKGSCVEVLEILPTAFLSALFLSDLHTSPLSAKLTPRHSLAGSFPIEKVLWNFGDGTDPVVITRNTTTSPDSRFVFTSALSADMSDPRNYDAVVVFYRKNDTDLTFYPSVSVVSSSTSSVNSAALTVGPLLSVAATSEFSDFRVIDSFMSASGKKVYGIQSNSTVGLVTD